MASKLTDSELREIYTFALDLGRRAGQILLDGVEKRCVAESRRESGKMEEKMNAVDIVTQTDLGESAGRTRQATLAIDSKTNHVAATDVEAFVKAEISGRYPDHK